jgi:hypothetical protein
MQAHSWISLLQLIPSSQHDSLMLMTTCGLEVMIQSILRAEVEYLVLRGRMAGSTDQGRVIFLPYDQISYLGYNKRIAEGEIQALFQGRPGALLSQPRFDAHPAPEPQPEAAPDESPAEAEAEAGPKQAPEPNAPDPSKLAARPAAASKSLFLARLRARLKGSGDGAAAGK